MKSPSEIHTEVETRRIVAALGYTSSEFLGATRESLVESVVIYKTLLDWVREKGWLLTDQQICDIEAAISDKLPRYVRTQFGTSHNA